jgi:hypothetical protein
MNQQAYTSTVVAPIQVAIGAVLALLVGTFMFARGASIWLVAFSIVLIAVSAVYLSTVRLGVNAERIIVSQSPFALSARVIDVSSVVEATRVDIGWPQVFGIGVPWHWRTSRLTVRPGPTLNLRLAGAERISISTSDPDAALRLLGTERKRHDQQQ